MDIRLSLFEVFSYLNATPASRNIREGESILNAGHIILCGATEFTNSSISTLGLCLQTSALTKPPHEIVGKFKIENGNALVKEMVCTCKAGLGEKCKHISAVLIHCSRYNMTELERISSTDVKCIWEKKKESALANYKSEPIADFKCVRYIPLNIMDETRANSIREILTSTLPECALAVHSSRLTKKLNIPTLSVLKSSQASSGLKKKQDFGVDNTDRNTFDYIHAIFTNSNLSPAMATFQNFSIFPLRKCCQAIYDSTIFCKNTKQLCIDTKTDLKRWQTERQYRITGSRCYSIYTYKGGNWELKSCKYFWPKKFSSIYTTHGLVHENEARSTYSTNLGRTVVECGLVVSEKNPFLAYSPDGIVFQNQKPIKLLEIKCPFKGREITAGGFVECCDYLKIENDRLILKKNHTYYAQVQLGMAVLNLKECDFIVFSSFDKTFLNIIVPYDDTFVNKLIAKLQNIYFQHMLHAICENKSI